MLGLGCCCAALQWEQQRGDTAAGLQTSWLWSGQQLQPSERDPVSGVWTGLGGWAWVHQMRSNEAKCNVLLLGLGFGVPSNSTTL